MLEELGENLLRACPTWGVLLTAHAADSYAAWYMRFSRGLRPDLLVVPLAAVRSDPVLQARLARDLKPGRRSGSAAWLPEIVKHRPVCVSMGFDRPPEVGSRIRWSARPLVNSPQFGRPGTSLGNPAFGVISSQANSPRQIQFGLKVLF